MRFRWYLAVLVLVPPCGACCGDSRNWRRRAIKTICAAKMSATQSRLAKFVRSLTSLTAVRGKLPGEVAGVEIDRKDGRWRYEFRVVDSQGRLFEVYIDARNGEIQRIKEK